MSKINNTAFVWVPPIFPAQGRLPVSETEVSNNYRKQLREEDAYRQKCNKEAGLRHNLACSQSLHISLFFDGTGNNEKNDTHVDNPAHPTNIAKLYHATYPLSAEAQGYYSYYMPGVGTPFPEVGELDYSNDGLMFASGGESRINWALQMVVDALIYTLTSRQAKIDDGVAKANLENMKAVWPLDGEYSRRSVIKGLLNPFAERVDKVRPKLLKIKLFIYGFSRGAAEARTFVNWLTELFDTPKGEDHPQQALLGIPLSIEFLGLLDTVPSVGVAHIVPLSDGHMSWADGTQQLPDEARFPDLIKCCHHFVAAHEQRLCFPMDSVRRREGDYPVYVKEVVYPGVHSDVGGGYPAGDQGKGREGVGHLLSQIVLHDMYAAAFEAGAPLAVPDHVVSDDLRRKQPARSMDLNVMAEFDFNKELIQRFNAWRTTLLPAAALAEPAVPATPGYQPHLLSQSLEDAVVAQIGWLTAWRIGRYAKRGYLKQPFYNEAAKSTQGEQEQAKKDRDEKQAAIEKARKEAAKNPKAPGSQAKLNQQGVPDFDPDIAQQQLREAAEEFRSDYFDEIRPQEGFEFIVQTLPKNVIYLINTDDEQTIYHEIKSNGDRLYPTLFPGPYGAATTEPRLANVLALYDEQIHDSRAWFMHSTLGTREPWGSYFFYRSIYCGSASNKDQYLFAVAGQLVGAAAVVGGVVYSVKRKNLNGVAGATGAVILERTLIDAVTGAPVPLLDSAAELFQPRKDSGDVIAQSRAQVITNQHQQSMKSMMDYLASLETAQV